LRRWGRIAGVTRPPRRLRSRAIRAALWCALVGVLAGFGSAAWTRFEARGRLYTDPETVPAAPVAIVLGAQVHEDGRPSRFLEARLVLAKRLYDEGRVRALLVTGDHGRWAYDEPGTMRRWLVDHGVPARKVVVDYAGFDTYDSCARARRIFGVRRAIVVTQAFHLPRAVTVCRAVGVDAVGLGDVSVRALPYWWWRGVAREQGACVKAALDVAVRRDPVFLGPHEAGVDDALRD
jgi:vancomycin permeability regulator SanA